MRVLKWIIERVEGTASARDTALGMIPDYDHLDWSGLAFDRTTFEDITAVNQAQWQQELALHDELLTKLQQRMPAAIGERYLSLKQAMS